MSAKEGPNAIKRAFAGLPDLNQCEEIIDYGNVEHNHELLIDTQRNSQILLLSLSNDINKHFTWWWS